MIVLILFGYFNNLQLYLLYKHLVIPTKYSNVFLCYHSLNVGYTLQIKSMIKLYLNNSDWTKINTILSNTSI